MDTRATQSLVSEDLAHLSGTTEDTNPSPLMTGVDGQKIQCTWILTFTAEFAGHSAVLGFSISPGNDHLWLSDANRLGVHSN